MERYYPHGAKVPASEPLEHINTNRCHKHSPNGGWTCLRTKGHTGKHVAHFWWTDAHHPFMCAEWGDDVAGDVRVLL